VRNCYKILLVAVLVGLLPLRSIAGAVTAFCSAGQEIAASHLEPQPQVPGQGQSDEASRCGLCVAHCPSGILISESGRPAIMAEFGQSRIPLGERGVPAFIPDPLDRPPLTLLR
jgi:ferredoxin